MPQYISLEVSAEQIADIMAEDGNFALEMWEELAERISMGAMCDDAGDLASAATRARARFLSEQFKALSETFAFGAENRAERG